MRRQRQLHGRRARQRQVRGAHRRRARSSHEAHHRRRDDSPQRDFAAFRADRKDTRPCARRGGGWLDGGGGGGRDGPSAAPGAGSKQRERGGGVRGVGAARPWPWRRGARARMHAGRRRRRVAGRVVARGRGRREQGPLKQRGRCLSARLLRGQSQAVAGGRPSCCAGSHAVARAANLCPRPLPRLPAAPRAALCVTVQVSIIPHQF
jgi:hypothetical protein